MKGMLLAAVAMLAFGMAGAGAAHAADTSKTAPAAGSDRPAMSGTSQPTKTAPNSGKIPTSLPPSPNRPTGSMADPPLASPPPDLGASHAPDK